MLGKILRLLGTLQGEEMSQTFDEIMDNSRKRRVGFVLNGVQANVLLLVLDLMATEELPRVFAEESSEGVRQIIDEVRVSMRKELKDNRFITLEALEEAAFKAVDSGLDKLGGPEIKKIIEETWNQGPNPGGHGNGNR